MRDTCPYEAAFHRALLEPGAPLPALLPPGERTARRLALHRRTVTGRLMATLAARHPAARALAGEAAFDALCLAFLRLNPPRGPVLHEWGQDLADFAAVFTPLANQPWLPDVIRLEAARLRAWHAAEAAAFDVEGLLRLMERETMPRLALHPSASLLASPFPLVSLWAGGLPAPEDRAGEEALVSRRGEEVVVHRLPAGGCAFARALAEGLPPEAAAEAALAQHPDFAPQEVLALLIEAEALTEMPG